MSGPLLKMFTQTPQKKRTLWIIAIVWLVLQPVFDAIYFSTNLWRGVYPWNADAIMIPIFLNTVELALISPAILYVVWVAAREYTGSMSFLAFNVRRVWWSAFCTCVAFWLVERAVKMLAWGIADGQWGDVLNAVFTTCFVMCLRSALMTSTRFFGRPGILRVATVREAGASKTIA